MLAKSALYLDLSGEFDSCWETETGIEAIETELSRPTHLILPSWCVLAQGCETHAQRLHLKLFLEARGATPASRTTHVLPRLPYRSLIGSRNPSLLILGDRHNVRSWEREQLAAFGPWSGCGPFLLEALPADIMDVIALANANEEDLAAMYGYLGSPHVVALGRAAGGACDAAGIKHGLVPHPQYIRRFFHSRLPEYGQLIAEAGWRGKDFTSRFIRERKPASRDRLAA